jgi:hypothetical protein
MNLLDEVFKARTYRAVHLLPLPIYYKFAHDTIARMLPEVEVEWPTGDSGHIWGIPFVVDDSVPTDVILFTTDFAEWQVLNVGSVATTTGKARD